MALFNQYSGGPKSKGEPHIHRNPWIAFLMTNMASGIAREHSHVNVAQHDGLVQLINWPKQRTSLILENSVMINWHLSGQGICWPVTRLCSWRSGVFFLSWLTTKYWFFDWNAGSSQINCDHGRVVSKPIIANSGWKVNQNVDFSCTKTVFHCLCFEQFENIQTQKANYYKQKTVSAVTRTQLNSRLSGVSLVERWITQSRS